MITIEQCRGARGTLGWTQQDLADCSGLSKTAINNFEKGHSDIKAESLRAIRLAFESADIEFIGREGLKKKTDTFKIINGSNALNELLCDIHKTLNGTTAELLISFVDQNLASHITTQKLFEHIEFLKNNKIRQRILCFEGAKHILSPSDECRWLNEDQSNAGTTSFIYGDKTALVLWGKTTIIITSNKEANNAEKQRFEELWRHAKMPCENIQNIEATA